MASITYNTLCLTHYSIVRILDILKPFRSVQILYKRALQVCPLLTSTGRIWVFHFLEALYSKLTVSHVTIFSFSFWYAFEPSVLVLRPIHSCCFLNITYIKTSSKDSNNNVCLSRHPTVRLDSHVEKLLTFYLKDRKMSVQRPALQQVLRGPRPIELIYLKAMNNKYQFILIKYVWTDPIRTNCMKFVCPWLGLIRATLRAIWNGMSYDEAIYITS